MNRPRVVVFDLGKVLLDFDYRAAAGKLAAQGRLPSSDIRQLIDQTPLLLRYECGLVTSEDFCRMVCAATGFRGSPEEFATCFSDIFTPVEPMIGLQARLRAAGVPTYIFSNTNDLAVRHIRQAYPFFAGFNGYIFSYEHRLMKPDPLLYAVVERVTGCSGGEILYIDDRPENAATGQSLGWQTILHHSPEATIQQVAGLLL